MSRTGGAFFYARPSAERVAGAKVIPVANRSRPMPDTPPPPEPEPDPAKPRPFDAEADTDSDTAIPIYPPAQGDGS